MRGARNRAHGARLATGRIDGACNAFDSMRDGTGSLAATAVAAELPIVDAHLHYSHDAWGMLPPKEAIAILRRAGVSRALVSSSSDDGTQQLYAEAPDLIVPELRAYRRRGELSTWMRDETVIAHVEDRLKRFRYVGIGEFHVFGADADLPVVRRMVELAKQHQLFLHAHSEADAVERLFRQDPGARILWAHSGFDRPEQVREMLRKHPNLWADLAFRNDHAPGGSSGARMARGVPGVSRPVHGRHRHLYAGALALRDRACQLVTQMAA